MRRWWLGPALALALGSDANPESLTIDPPVVSVGGLAVVRVGSPAASGTFDGKPLQFFRGREGLVALVGIDLDQRPGRYTIEVSNPGGPRLREGLEVVAKAFPEERLTVPRDYTELTPEVLRRVERERKLLDSLWSRRTPRRLWVGDFAKPAEGEAGSPFGLRRYFNGEPRSPHAGIDIRTGVGAPVRASNRGRVVLARELFFTGNTVVLDHGLGVFTMYVHLSKIGAGGGEIVDRGREIGKVGATGRATGPHLHFSARVGGARVDPQALLDRALD